MLWMKLGLTILCSRVLVGFSGCAGYSLMGYRGRTVDNLGSNVYE